MTEKLTSCLQCGASIPEPGHRCSACGAEGDTVWPPPVAFTATGEAAKPKLLTGNHKWEVFLGCLIGTVSSLLLLVSILTLIFYHTTSPHYWIGLKSCCLTMLFELVLYRLLRKPYPVLARNCLVSSMALMVILTAIDAVFEAAVVYFDSVARNG